MSVPVDKEKFRDILYKLLIVLLTSTVIVWLSVFLYVTFYYTYMPAVSHTKPVHLQFRYCEDNSMCSFPHANISLIKKGQEQLLMRGQQYKVFLDLEMPESPVNQQLGMFMIKLEFLSKIGGVIHTATRSAMLRYKSPLLQTFSTVFLTPFLMLGTTEEKQLLSVELCDFYEEDPVKPAHGVNIEVQSRNVEIYSSQLRIYAHFTGLRYMMFHWPVLSAIIGIGTNLFFLSVVALLSWYRYLVNHESHQVVVRVEFDNSRLKNMEERRNQVKDFLLREKQRQAKMRASFTSFEMSGPIKSVKAKESLTRTHSLEHLSHQVQEHNARKVSAMAALNAHATSPKVSMAPGGRFLIMKTPPGPQLERSRVEEVAQAEKTEDFDEDLLPYDHNDIGFEDGDSGSDQITFGTEEAASEVKSRKEEESGVRLRKTSKET